MRALAAVAALSVLLVSCKVFDARPGDSPAPSTPTASPPPAVVLSKIPIVAKLGEQGIRVSPNGELLLVVEREGFQHTIYDLAGRTLASHKLGEIAMNPFWLPDSSGVVTGRRVSTAPGSAPVLDLLTLELDGTIGELARRVSYPGNEALQVSPDGSSLALATPCCPSSVQVVSRRGGAQREIASSPTQLRVLGWDAEGHVLFWPGADAIDAARADGAGYRVALGLPAGVKALDIVSGGRTADAAANLFKIQADGAMPGAASGNIASRTLVARELRPFDSAAALHMRVSGHELLTHTRGAFGAYDLTTGVTRSLATIAGDDGTVPTAMSGRIVLTSPGRTWVRVFDVDRDDRWHEAEVGVLLQTTGYALSRGRFLVFDESGAPYALDGVAARAAPARAALAQAPNAVAGTIRTARNAVVGKKMELAWQMPDGAPQSLDYVGGSLVVVSLWTRVCIVCTQQLGLISDVTVGSRSRVEVFTVGVDETEASALDVAKDHKRLRPLVGSRAALKDIGVDVLPQTFILDGDHIVRQVIVGPLSWDALVRALTAASKSRLALRDGDVALS